MLPLDFHSLKHPTPRSSTPLTLAKKQSRSSYHARTSPFARPTRAPCDATRSKTFSRALSVTQQGGEKRFMQEHIFGSCLAFFFSLIVYLDLSEPHVEQGPLGVIYRANGQVWPSFVSCGSVFVARTTDRGYSRSVHLIDYKRCTPIRSAVQI